MQKRIGLVLVSAAIIVLAGCGKQNDQSQVNNTVAASGTSSEATAPDVTASDNDKKAGPLSALSEFIGTHSANGSSTYSGFDVSVELEIFLTESQFVVKKTCTRARHFQWESGSVVVQASGQIQVIDRNHFQLAGGIAQSQTLYIPDESRLYPTDDVECSFKFPAGIYVLDYIGNELVLGGPEGLIARFPKR